MTTKQERRLVRTSQPRDYPLRKEAEKPKTMPKRVSRRADLTAALDEWAEDYAGNYSVFGD